ncbi:MAG: hypothetical protein ACK4UO_07880 [Pseudolabrys sp.]
MADYIPLISRAVGGLEHNTGENRRVLYERARVALVNQLRSLEPPLEEADITRERLALEDAIRRVEAEAAQAEEAPAEEAPAEAPPADDHPRLREQGLRDFRETMAEAEGLGEASSTATRSAREAYERMPGEPAPHAAEPLEPAPHYFEPPAEESAAPGEPEAERAEAPPFEPPPPEQHPEPLEEDEYARPPRDWSRIVKVGVLLLVVLGLAAVGYWQRGTISSMVAGLRSSPPAVEKPTARPAPPAGQPKIADRIGPSSDTAAPSTAPAAAVAQKVVLYDEDTSDPQGKRYVGSAIWRTETVSPGPGLAPELAVRADVEIPERRLRMTWSLRRNTDKALPASHTIEILFSVPADFAEGGINNVPGVLMKQNEQARGVPLAGLAVKVTTGYFLIGLSAVEIDVQRNSQLLKERDWFDIPIVYTSGKRAILAVEKGTPGARAFEEAFRAWGQ